MVQITGGGSVSALPGWSVDETMHLGRMVQQASMAELFGRHLLGRALGLDYPTTESLFLGDRFSDLNRRFTALAKMPAQPEWHAPAQKWWREAAKCFERRDELVHRPRGMLADQAVLAPSRRRHVIEPVDMAKLAQLDQDFTELLRRTPALHDDEVG